MSEGVQGCRGKDAPRLEQGLDPSLQHISRIVFLKARSYRFFRVEKFSLEI
jgi:hypothetical protein